MRVVVGVERLDGGEVLWDGAPLDPEARRRIGYMPEERGLYPKMRARDQLVYLARLRGAPRAAARDAATGCRCCSPPTRLELVERLCETVTIVSAGRLVADGSVRQLRREGAPRRLVVDVSTSEESRGWAGRLEGVEVLRSDDEGLVLGLDDGTDDQAVLRAAQAAGPVHRFAPVVPSLAERYRAVTVAARRARTTRRRGPREHARPGRAARVPRAAALPGVLDRQRVPARGPAGRDRRGRSPRRGRRTAAGGGGRARRGRRGADGGGAVRRAPTPTSPSCASRPRRRRRDAVRAGRVDAALVDGGTVVVPESLSSGLGGVLDQARRVVAVRSALAGAGLSPAEQQAALDPPPLRVEATSPQDAVQLDADVAVGVVAGFALYGLLITYGQQVAQGVVEEKQSRVIEVLLATVRPVPLLAGKVVGLGLLGLVQVLTLATVGLAGGRAHRRRGRLRVDPRHAGPGGRLVRARLRAVLHPVRARRVARLPGRGPAEHDDARDLPARGLPAPRAVLLQRPAGRAVAVLRALPVSAPRWPSPCGSPPASPRSGRCWGPSPSRSSRSPCWVPLAARAYSGTALRTRGRTGLREALASDA